MSIISEKERQIHQHLIRQMEIYTHALPIAEALAQQFEVNPQKQQQLAQLEAWMQQAFSEHQQMQALLPKDPAELHHTPVVRDTSRQLTEQIARMIKFFDAIEQKAHEIKQTLSPRLNESLRARQMRAAYVNPDS